MKVTPSTLQALEKAAADLDHANRIRAKAVEEARRTVREAHNAGMTEVELAAMIGVNRLTIRRWLGK